MLFEPLIAVSAHSSLGQKLQKLLFAVVCLAVVAFYFESIFRTYGAAKASADPAQLARAVMLAPEDAGYHHLLGRYLFFTGQNTTAALEHYRRATELNPRIAAVWLDLAQAYQARGESSSWQQALARALAIDSHTPDVAWQAGQQQLAAGQTLLALRQFQVVIAHDSTTARTAIDLAWRATHDPKLLLQEAIPVAANSRLQFLNYMIEHRERAGAALAWSEIVNLNQRFAPELAVPYVDFLLTSNDDAGGALAVWQFLQSLDPQFSTFTQSGGIVNAGFEQPVLSAGLDWRSTPPAGVSATIDVNNAYKGTKSLAVVLDGTPIDDVGVFQYLVLRPSTNYEFSAYVRDESIAGVGGLRFQISGQTSTPYYTSGQLPESDSWEQVHGSFRTPKQPGAAILKIVCRPARQHLRGRFWIDELELIAQ